MKVHQFSALASTYINVIRLLRRRALRCARTVFAGSLCTVNDTTSGSPDPRDLPLEQLVGRWLTVPDIAERLGVPLSSVRRMIEDRQLLSARVGERSVVSVPAKFLDEATRPHLRGTFTVLADAGMDDEEILRWLFTPDPTLPVEGGPIDALAAGFKTEVRRRAMESAF